MINLENVIEPEIKVGDVVGVFKGLEGGPGEYVRYPCRMYRDGADPVTVEDTEEEDKAKLSGYDHVSQGQMANKHLINWYWDLEDMSARQLVVFAKDEYGVDLPIGAGQDKLFSCVIELSRHAPKNRGSIVMMAHSIKMNYDATLEEIRRMADATGPDYEIETETWEIIV